MTLDELKAQIRIETQRPSSRDDELTEYINHAIRDISRDADFRFLRTTGSITTTSTTRAVDLPTRCGSILSLHYHDTTSGGSEGTRALRPATPTEARRMYGEASTGKPYYYLRRPKVNDTAVETLDLWPAPDAAYTLELEHFQFFASLSGTTDTNVISVDYPWLVIKRANMRLFNAVGDDEGAARAMRQYAMERSSVLGEERRDNSGQPGAIEIDMNVLPDRAIDP